MKALLQLAGCAFALAATAGCRRDMADQAHHEPLEVSEFFADGAASRPLPAHTIARGELRENQHFFAGMNGKAEATTFPQPVTRELLERGHERYDIYCSPCHGLNGDGLGMIVRRGFPPPPSFHQDRLRQAPPGHYFQVITNGFGLMYPYAQRVEPADRWAITAYIRALQLSQNATLADADPAGRKQLEEARQ